MTDHISALDTDTLILPGTTELQKFLKPFNYKLITVAVFPEAPGANLMPRKLFAGNNKIRAMTLEQLVSDRVQTELRQVQNDGLGVFFMINEGDGKPDSVDPSNLNCGKNYNVIQLKTLAIDCDGANPEELDAELVKIGLKPHLIVNTSPEKTELDEDGVTVKVLPPRFHYYFLLKPVEADQETEEQWSALQKKLASLLLGLDLKVHDVSRKLRLPGFYNIKDKPFLTKVTEWSSHDPYDLKFTYDRLEAHAFRAPVLVNGHDGSNGLSYNKFVYPAARHSLLPGQRRPTICSFIEHLMENIVPLTAPDEIIYFHVNGFVTDYCRPCDHTDYLPGGKARGGIDKYYHDQKAYRINKNNQKASQLAVQQFDHAQAVEESKLPDEFYLTFPGDLGIVVREIHAFSPVLSLEMCFAGALCISGALKADRFRLKGHWPLVNGLVIAHTAAGKTTLKEIVTTVFYEAGLLGKYPRLLQSQKSVQSLHDALRAAGGAATVIVDEAGGYLEALESSGSAAHFKNIKDYMKSTTTGSGIGVWVGPGDSKNNDTADQIQAMLSVWMFLQPIKFVSSLSMDDLRDGFLPRFLIFRGESNIDAAFETELPDDPESYDFQPSVDLRVWFESLTRLFPFTSDLQLADVLEAAERDARATNPRAGVHTVRIAKQYAVYAERLRARKEGPRVTVIFTPEAREAQRAYILEWRTKTRAIHKGDKTDPRMDVALRVREMFYRLLCNASQLSHGGTEPGVPGSVTSLRSGTAQNVPRGTSAIIDLPLIEAVIRFHRFQTERFFRNELSEMGKDQEIETVVNAVLKATKKYGRAVTARELDVTKNKRKTLSSLLREATTLGRLIEEPAPRTGRHKDKTKTVYYIDSGDLDQLE